MSAADPGSALGLPSTKERQVLVLDLSKSMLAPLPDPGEDPPEKQKIEVARTAVFRILENVESSSGMFGLVTFTETPRVAVPLTEIRRENLPYIESLISVLTPSGRSAIWDALALAADLLRAGPGGVHGQIVLVTDGWDNASTRFEVPDANGGGTTGHKMNLLPYVLPSGSTVTLRVIGIGSGEERDKGVDSGRMNRFLSGLTLRAQEVGAPAAFTYQEVVTGSQLFQQMVHAFLDIEFEERRSLGELHPDELAQHAAHAARALKEPLQHATVNRLSDHLANPAPPDAVFSEAPALEVDVLSTTGGALPPYLKERYGPLGGVIEAYLAKDFGTATERLERAGGILPSVTRLYWAARIRFGAGEIVDAARLLLQAWNEAERLPASNRGRVIRRLALLQARMQRDKETESLVHFLDETESKTVNADAATKARLEEMFQRLLELRGTYQLARIGATDGGPHAAVKHEEAVERIFDLLQDARMESAGTDPTIDGALDFIELCLAEMR